MTNIMLLEYNAGNVQAVTQNQDNFTVSYEVELELNNKKINYDAIWDVQKRKQVWSDFEIERLIVNVSLSDIFSGEKSTIQELFQQVDLPLEWFLFYCFVREQITNGLFHRLDEEEATKLWKKNFHAVNSFLKLYKGEDYNSTTGINAIQTYIKNGQFKKCITILIKDIVLINNGSYGVQNQDEKITLFKLFFPEEFEEINNNVEAFFAGYEDFDFDLNFGSFYSFLRNNVGEFATDFSARLEQLISQKLKPLFMTSPNAIFHMAFEGNEEEIEEYLKQCNIDVDTDKFSIKQLEKLFMQTFPNFSNKYFNVLNFEEDSSLQNGIEFSPKRYFSLGEGKEFLEVFFQEYQNQNVFTFNENTGLHTNIGYRSDSDWDLFKMMLFHNHMMALKNFPHRFGSRWVSDVKQTIIATLKAKMAERVEQGNSKPNLEDFSYILNMVIFDNIKDAGRRGDKDASAFGKSRNTLGVNFIYAITRDYVEFRYPGGVTNLEDVWGATLYFAHLVMLAKDPRYMREEFSKKLAKFFIDTFQEKGMDFKTKKMIHVNRTHNKKVFQEFLKKTRKYEIFSINQESEQKIINHIIREKYGNVNIEFYYRNYIKPIFFQIHGFDGENVKCVLLTLSEQNYNGKDKISAYEFDIGVNLLLEMFYNHRVSLSSNADTQLQPKKVIDDYYMKNNIVDIPFVYMNSKLTKTTNSQDSEIQTYDWYNDQI